MLSSEERRRGRAKLLWFGVFNALSFTLLTGNLVSLYILRLGASNGLVGVIASFSYAAFFMLFLGRSLVPRVGVIRLFAWAWAFRYAAFMPVLFAPVFLLSGQTSLTFLLVGAGVLGFHLFRGVGIVANAPLFGGFSDHTDRGRLMSQFQMIAAVVTVLIGVAVAYMLGRETEIGRYTLFLGAGVMFGVVATGIVFTLPELEDERESARQPMLPMVRAMIGRPEIRRFFATFLLVAIASGIGRSFLIVWAKQLHGMTDRTAFLMVAIGSVGNFVAGYLGSVLLDRLGARPLLLFSLLAYIVSSFAAAIAPPVGANATVVVVGLVFFLGTLGFTGNENSSQAYFFGITDRNERLNLGILFFLTLGIGGTIGSFSAGFVLDALMASFGVMWAFRIFFSITGVIAIVAWLRATRLASLGAETFRDTVGVIFSFRDLRTMGLLHRLNRTRDLGSTTDAIRSIAHSGSEIAVADVAERLSSPSYAVRLEALEALFTLPYTEDVERALLNHLTEAIHTTAFRAVRILGLRGTKAAIPAVREAIGSTDVMLADRAIVAYARLAGSEAIEPLREFLVTATNPRRLLHVAVAVSIAGHVDDVPILLGRLERTDLPDYVVDEIILAASRILEIHDWFFPRYSDYVRPGSDRIAVLDDLGSALSGSLAATIRSIPDKDATASKGWVTPLVPHLPIELQEVAVSLPMRGRTAFFLAAVVGKPGNDQ